MSGWADSNRRLRLPSDWSERRAAVLRRDPICRLRLACGGAPSTEVDHVERGDDHRLANLQGACRACHLVKSSAEGHAARYRFSRRRPAEPHPGVLGGGG